MYIFCYSFNQNGNYINADVLNHVYEQIGNTGKRPEILVLGFQETRYGFEYYWHGLRIHQEYALIRKLRLNGIGNVGIRGLGLYILARRDFSEIQFIEENWVRFNYQYFGKGAISIVVQIAGERFLFINTHLPYHEYWEGGGIKERVDSLNVIFEYIISKTSYDYIFLMGDFNFRIHLKTKNQYASMIAEDDPKLFEMYVRNRFWKLLYFNDELYLLNFFYNNYLQDLLNKNIGAEYGYRLEVPLLPFYRHVVDKFDFPPTYKVYRDRKEIQDPFSEKLDLDRYYERWNTDRIPSWCDRILTIQNPILIRLSYNSMDSPLIANSDHIPVWSLFIKTEPSRTTSPIHQNTATYSPSSQDSSHSNTSLDS